ncbi:DNA-binding WRKY [Artemisia annua]|uniref:DNA-binding WRKY n=1 Tax=Artemisia annua TaxID=35608 RepID=A0A2U1M8X2_ARTAN|nr:DNA-binding WRKY [Artemisia annua]
MVKWECRKSQAKKVVCIPAPAPANSRPTGEVVPSDLWAWRKYGQKPIKGSPYPRGYYRCSSSKGCSARKQVERSRTDPNMLVITYTSEHNHPWPTQRNALAGTNGVQVKDELQTLEPSFPQGYRPELPEHGSGMQPDHDFFSSLGEIEVDPISMLLNQGFLGGDEEEDNYNKDLDPFG